MNNLLCKQYHVNVKQLKKIMIEIKNVSKIFTSGDAEIKAVNNVSFLIPEGEFVAITGRSGSGKSTLLYQLGLLDQPTSGTIIIDGVTVTDIPEHDQARLRLHTLGYIFQDYAILPSLTALENVMVPLELRGERNVEPKAKELLGRVGLANRMHHYPSQLSGGEQQRVAMARAFITDPKILFADEPTGNLDEENAHHITELLFGMNKEKGTTLVLVTHNLDLAKQTQRLLKMKGGKITEQVEV